MPANQLGRQGRQSIDMILGPAVFNRYILTLDNARVFKALAECAHTLPHSVRRSGVKNPITGITGCCACTAIGHTAAVLPRTRRNSRRRISAPSLGRRHRISSN
jgi:hypothetical protein